MKILTLGLGYIGLPTALMFAKHGAEVVGIDISAKIVEQLNAGKVHIKEPGITTLLQDVLNNGHFRASLELEESDVFIVAVPTPNLDDRYKSCDIAYVVQAVRSVLPYLKAGNTIIIESTIAPRTTTDIVKPLIEKAGFQIGTDVYLVHCPERVLPGKVLRELVDNNRIIGGVTPQCTIAAEQVYRLFVQGKLIATSAATAELAKLMENTYRDVNIALANELIKTGNALNIDALEAIQLANQHPRVNLHHPGPGVGGHCLAVDPYFISSASPDTTPLIQAARLINTTMPNYIVDKTNQIMETIKGHKITILGLAYKGNIDDIRESPALEIWQLLKKEQRYTVTAFDPYVEVDGAEASLSLAIENSDLLLILTDHDSFKQINIDDISNMRQKVVFDTKNIFPEDMKTCHHLTLGNLSSLNNLPSITLIK